jgi:UDPglucose--hexose-1-phosphate uridylyltransferase
MDLQIDPLTGATVIIAGSRQGRPNLPTAGCPFCVGGLQAPEPYETKSFVNRWPSIGEGRSEVVLFSPDHDASLATMPTEAVTAVVDLWAARTEALGARADVSYVLVFENHGAAVGATIPHPHGQIFAFGDIPPVPAQELALAEHGCTHCEGPPPEHLVATHGAGSTAWRAWVPAASPHPFGLVLAPVTHEGALPDLDHAARAALAHLLGDVLARLDRHFAASTPYMLWFHQRPYDGQPWPQAHLHAEIVPLWRAPGVPRYVASGELGSGVFINPVEPPAAAAALREA